MTTDLCVAILAKDKAYCLPLFLQSIVKQTYPKNKTHLYIRTNDNKDETDVILKEWLEEFGKEYASVHYDDSNIDSTLKEYKEHQWNPHRFTILGAIRQQSVRYAQSKGLDYFTADCDNILTPNCISRMMEVKHLGVVSPLLDSTIRASNLHHCADPNGYYKECKEYDCVRYKTVRGLIEVDVAHMTYMIANEFLPFICYDDGSQRYEYVVFSDALRKNSIKQFMDSRFDYGFMIHEHDEYEKVIKEYYMGRYTAVLIPDKYNQRLRKMLYGF